MRFRYQDIAHRLDSGGHTTDLGPVPGSGIEATDPYHRCRDSKRRSSKAIALANSMPHNMVYRRTRSRCDHEDDQSTAGRLNNGGKADCTRENGTVARVTVIW